MAKYKKRPEVVSPRGIAVYPYLNEPNTKFDADGVYKVGVRVDRNDPEAANFIAVLEHCREENHKAQTAEHKKKIKLADLPITEETDDDGNETGMVVINFKMKAKKKSQGGSMTDQRPAIFDAAGQPISANVWGGSEIKAAAFVNSWYVPATGAGISLNLRAVQVFKLVEPGGGDADHFGFQQEEGYEAPQPTEEDAQTTQADGGQSDAGNDPASDY